MWICNECSVGVYEYEVTLSRDYHTEYKNVQCCDRLNEVSNEKKYSNIWICSDSFELSEGWIGEFRDEGNESMATKNCYQVTKIEEYQIDPTTEELEKCLYAWGGNLSSFISEEIVLIYSNEKGVLGLFDNTNYTAGSIDDSIKTEFVISQDKEGIYNTQQTRNIDKYELDFDVYEKTGEMVKITVSTSMTLEWIYNNNTFVLIDSTFDLDTLLGHKNME